MVVCGLGVWFGVPSSRSLSLRLPLSLSSLCQGFFFIRSSLRPLFLRLPLGMWVGRVEEGTGFVCLGWVRIKSYFVISKRFTITGRMKKFLKGVFEKECILNIKNVYLLPVKVFSLLGLLLDPIFTFSFRLLIERIEKTSIIVGYSAFVFLAFESSWSRSFKFVLLISFQPLHQRVVSQKAPEMIDDWEMIKECFCIEKISIDGAKLIHENDTFFFNELIYVFLRSSLR
ncbi:unnamed protein product [Rhizophagus irregularis]|nr:unnamed protein product [Rhizophagus irregularis]